MLYLYLGPSFMMHLAECHRFTPERLKSLKLPGLPQSKLGLAMHLYLPVHIRQILTQFLPIFCSKMTILANIYMLLMWMRFSSAFAYLRTCA